MSSFRSLVSWESLLESSCAILNGSEVLRACGVEEPWTDGDAVPEIVTTQREVCYPYREGGAKSSG